MTTTLNKIREHKPCSDGWEKLLKALGKTMADDEELSIFAILESNGLDDAIWCLRAVDGKDFEIRRFARFCALLNIEIIKPNCGSDDYDLIVKWLNTGDESIRSAAWAAAESAAAWSAARAAARSAESAVWAAAESAARSAAESAARSAAWAAARSAQIEELTRLCKDSN